VRSRRIPNWLLLPSAVSAIVLSFTPLRVIDPSSALLGLLVGFGLPLILYAMGAMGGGDVKMFAVIGAWLGTAMVFWIFLMASIVGMVIVVAQALVQGRMRILARNSAVLSLNLVHFAEVGAAHVRETGQSCRGVEKPLPYAVPALVATVLALLLG
jgi:Flp pilus assembly protein protease CpaA